jgi:hypothetical protein
MKILRSACTATLFICLSFAHQACAQSIFFDTTGDFGLNDNWSDPTKAPPETAGLEHLGYFYYINGGRTATISAGSPNGSHFEVVNIFPGDSPAAEPPTTGTLIFNGGVAPAPGEFGATLAVLGTNRFIVGQRCNLGGSAHAFDACSGGGTVVMNGASDLLADGIVIGERDEGDLIIGPDARVRSGHLDGTTFSRQDIRIGSFGESRGLAEPIPVRLEGDGYIEVAGELVGNTIYMPESGAKGVLRVLPGGIVNVRGIDMRFEAFRTSRSSKVEIVGSGGSFTMTSGTLLASHPTATLSFTADAGGVTPITGGASADIETGNLVLDLDDFNFTPTSTLTLLDVPADGLFGTFGSVTFLGSTTADINYDYPNGDIFLSNFVSTEPPGVSGDYNDDGKVDAADYVVWRNNNGTTTVLPNDTTPGIVSPADFDVWRSHFGMTSGAGVLSASVPEPAAIILCLAIFPLACTRGRLRRKRT